VPKFFDVYYWLFRVVVPGHWLVFLTWLIGRLHYAKHALSLSKHVVELGGVSAVLACGIGAGLFLHYIVQYPRRRARFREIEKEYGPIDYLLSMCKACDKACTMEKSFTGMKYFYFSLLNETIPVATRSRVYYFSSIYLMFAHIAFVSVALAVVNGVCAVERVVVMESRLDLNSAIVSVVLICLCWLLLKRNGAPENYLIQMFEIQKEWVRRNMETVRERLCKVYRSSVQV